MRVTVNGEPREMANGTSAADLLGALRIEPLRVVVEVNLKILKRHELPTTTLHEGDRVEIVHFVGGG